MNFMNNSWSAARTRLFVLFASIFLVACASVETTKVEQKTTVSPECDNSAKYARSIGVLKAAGIPVDELEQYMTNPVVTSIPMRDIQNYSMFFKGNPNELYDSVLKLCAYSGWAALGAQLRGETPATIGGLKLTHQLQSIPTTASSSTSGVRRKTK